MFTFLFVLISCGSIFANVILQVDERDDEIIDLSQFGARIFGQPIENNQDELDGNFEEQGPYLEGDLLTPSTARNGMKSESLRWKNGVVPFEIRGSFCEFLVCLVEIDSKLFNIFQLLTTWI